MSTNMACQACCSNNHTTGYDTFVTALLSCACGAGGCTTVCASTACAATPSNPNAACNNCLNDVQTAPDGGPGVCDSDIANACNADPDCINGFIACADPCLSLP
jgi:hypothetical protein